MMKNHRLTVDRFVKHNMSYTIGLVNMTTLLGSPHHRDLREGERKLAPTLDNPKLPPPMCQAKEMPAAQTSKKEKTQLG